MKQDFASVARFIMDEVGNSENATLTFENKKDNFDYPLFYFPYPEEVVSRITVEQSYQTDCSLFLHIFSFSNEKAMDLAHKVKHAILSNNCLIPLYEEDGTKTNETFHIRLREVRRIDDSVSEVYITWRSVENLADISDGTIQNFFYGINTGG